MRIFIALLVCTQAAAFSRRAPPTMSLLSKLRDLVKPNLPAPIKVGDAIPNVKVENVQHAYEDGYDPQEFVVDTASVLGGNKTVLFGLPGAFTPTCSDVHLSGYVREADRFADLGYDLFCTSESDRYVLGAWNRSLVDCCGLSNRNVRMLSDADAALTTALGLREDMGFGFGVRSKRFALALNDGVVTHVATDPGMDECLETSAASLLRVLDPRGAGASGDAAGVLAVAAAAALALLAFNPDLLDSLGNN